MIEQPLPDVTIAAIAAFASIAEDFQDLLPSDAAELAAEIDAHLSPRLGTDNKAIADAIIRLLRSALATPAPAQPDPLHVANERGEGEDAFPALHALTEAILTRADADFMQRRLTEAVRIMATHGWEPPVPFPAAPKEKP